MELYQVGVYAQGQGKRFEAPVVGYISADEAKGLTLRQVAEKVMTRAGGMQAEEINDLLDNGELTGIEKTIPKEVSTEPMLIRMNGTFTMQRYNPTSHPLQEGSGIDLVMTKQIYTTENDILIAKILLRQ